MARSRLFAALVFLLAGPVCVAGPVVLTFDGLEVNQPVPAAHMGVLWERGTGGFGGRDGAATVVSQAEGARPKSLPNAVVNEWGVTRINIRFEAGAADFHGASFARYGDVESFWAPFVGFVGFRTLDDPAPYLAAIPLPSKPTFLQVDFRNVVMVQITSAAGQNGSGGWYTLDDLSYTPVPEPSSLLALGCSVSACLLIRPLRRR